MKYKYYLCSLILTAAAKDLKCSPHRLKNLSNSTGSAPVIESSGKKFTLPFL